MIYVDPRDGAAKTETHKEFIAFIRALGIPSEAYRLDSADFAFEGNGPRGRILIGVERKTIHDMLNRIRDNGYVEQRRRMMNQYAKSFLAFEGMWEPEYRSSMEAHMMEGFLKDGKYSFGHARFSSQYVLYSSLFNYLLSVALSGVIITYSHSIFHTAFNIVCIYKYFQKKWANHTSLLEVDRIAIPTLTNETSLARRWAVDIDGIGVKYSAEAERMFKTPYRLAHSEESDWMRIGNIGAGTAIDIIKQIHGRDR